MTADITPSRWLPVEGAYNVRDLGGYRTEDGRMTRWRTFLRADDLYKLTDADQNLLTDYGVRTVIDLRGSDELAQLPNVLAKNPNVTYLHQNMDGDDPLRRDGEPDAEILSVPERIRLSYSRRLRLRQDAIREILSALGAKSSAIVSSATLTCQPGSVSGSSSNLSSFGMPICTALWACLRWIVNSWRWLSFQPIEFWIATCSPQKS